MNKIIQGDAIEELKKLPDESIDLIFTDPPFNLKKDYGNSKDSLKEEEYYKWSYAWIDELVRILKPTGNLYIMNLPKHLAYYHTYLKSKGFLYKNWIIWIRNDNSLYPKKKQFKPNHQDILRFVKTNEFYFNWRGSARVPIWKKDKRVKDLAGDFDTWNDILYVKGNSKRKENHPCMLPEKLLRKIILSSSKEGDLVLDCFAGSGTTGVVAKQNNRKYILIELNEEFIGIIKKRLKQEVLSFKE